VKPTIRLVAVETLEPDFECPHVFENRAVHVADSVLGMGGHELLVELCQPCDDVFGTQSCKLELDHIRVVK
jgi:hypothetical protein